MKGDVKLDYITEVIPVMGTVVKYTILLIYRGELQDIFVDIHEIWNTCSESERKVVRNFEKKIRVLFKCYLSSIVITSSLYVYFSLTIRLPPVEPNGPERKILMFRSVCYIACYVM